PMAMSTEIEKVKSATFFNSGSNSLAFLVASTFFKCNIKNSAGNRLKNKSLFDVVRKYIINAPIPNKIKNE
ncbi:MAG: hypothetical protein ACKVJC_11120, partial [Flavobacteriales bacterium]